MHGLEITVHNFLRVSSRSVICPHRDLALQTFQPDEFLVLIEAIPGCSINLNALDHCSFGMTQPQQHRLRWFAGRQLNSNVNVPVVHVGCNFISYGTEIGRRILYCDLLALLTSLLRYCCLLINKK